MRLTFKKISIEHKAMNTNEMIQYINERYSRKYNTDKLEYKTIKASFILNCPKHGEFTTNYNTMLLSKLSSACPICKKLERGEVYDTESCKLKIESRYGKDHFNLSKLEYNGYRKEVVIGCKNGHGFFSILPDRIYVYDDCPQCSLKAKYSKRLLSIEEYIKKASEKHKNLYTYDDLTSYNGLLKPVIITCKKHGNFTQLAGNHLGGKGCPTCGIVQTKAEIEIIEWLQENNIKYVHKHRNKYEIDIYIPEYKIGIEYNGLYWHSEIYKEKDYHQKKRDHFAKQDIRIIYIWEDEWKTNSDKLKQYLLYQLGKCDTVFYARKCSTKEIESKIANKFLETHHLLGKTIAKHYIGLYYNNNLVSVAAFSNSGSSRGQNCWELIRYASVGSVIGGLGKIMKYFTTQNSVKQVISYTDNDKFSGNSYQLSGFILIDEIKPDYKTFSQKEYWRHAKQYTKLSNLVKILTNFNPELTEHANCLNNEIYRVYDSGKLKWTYNSIL